MQHFDDPDITSLLVSISKQTSKLQFQVSWDCDQLYEASALDNALHRLKVQNSYGAKSTSSSKKFDWIPGTGLEDWC